MPRLRRRVRAAAIAATAELPQRQAAFDVVRADVYRLQLAVAFLLEAAPDPGSPDPTARAIAAQLATVVAAVRDRIAMGPWPGVAKDDVHTALARLVETVMAAPLADELQRYDLLRGAAALGRVLAATVELDAILHHDAPPPPMTDRSRRARTRPACGLRPGWHARGWRPPPSPRRWISALASATPTGRRSPSCW